MADRVVGNLAIRLDFDGAKFEQGITKAKRELSTYNKATQASTRIAKSDNYEKGKSAVALNNMQVQYKGLQGTLQSHADMNKKLIEQGKENSGAFEKNENAMRNYEVQMWELNEQYKQFQKEMYTANSGFTKMGDTMTKVGGAMQTFGSGLTEIGTGITKVGAMASASLGLVAKMAIEFEEGMVQVQKTTNASAEEMAVFEEQIRGLALAMPIAVGELANVAALAGQLGVAQEDIAGFTETMAMLGTATNLSAEEAGNALARFQNVTGTSVDTVENLGSAIVHLGNNFATQEDSIINLGMMLAGSMTTVGAAETDILGLSAAMSALGITAERGGSSMSKFFVDMASDVSNGADSLDTFSKVAGMSKQAFTELFNQDSMAAVEAFIVGLGGVGESGGDMLAVLADLDINEIRLRDTILRLANGHEVLSEALDYSKQGFEENIALTEEYELLAGTTASQVQIAKNQLQDLAITAGQELLPAIMDLLNNSDGIIDMLKGAVDWFVSLDDEMKQNLVKWSAMALVIGPVVSGLGNVISGLGGLVTIGGAANKAIGRLDGALKAKAAGGLIEATVASQGLAGAKGLGGVVTAITGGTGLIWALGLAGVALGGWTLWKTWGEDAWEAGERTRKWGTDVTDATDSVLTGIQETGGRFTLMQQGLNADSGLMVQDFQSLGQVIEDDINRRLEITEAHLSGLPTVLQGTLREMWEEHNAGLIETRDAVIANNEEIARVQAQVAEQGGKATAEQLAYINELQRSSSEEYISILNLTAEEEKAIRAALSGDIESISQEQAATLYRSLADENGKLSQERRQLLDETEAWLIEVGELNTDFGRESLQAVEKYYDAMGVTGQRTMQELVGLYPDLVNTINLATGDLLSTNGEARDLQIEANKAIMDSWDERTTNTEQRADEIKRAQELIVDSNRAGATTWNRLVAESGGNMDIFREKVMETAKTAEGWNHMRFQIHEANLDSNARLIIAEAAIQNGYWDGMAWEDKQALLKDNFSETVYKAIVDEGTWDKLEWEEQFAVLNNEFSDGVIRAIMDEGKWKDLPWEQKHAVLTTNSPETLKQVLEDIGVWKTLPIPVRNLLADKTQLDKTVENAQKKLNSLRDKTVTITTRNQTIYESIYRAQGNKASTDWVQTGGSILHNARGTNNHPGGLAMVNDQMGSLYKELITLPDGQSFIPKGRNVVLDLPEGTKVLRAALTKMKIPKYRDGIGYSKQQERSIIQSTKSVASPTINLYQTINSPREVDARESQRLARINMQQLAYQLGGV